MRRSERGKSFGRCEKALTDARVVRKLPRRGTSRGRKGWRRGRAGSQKEKGLSFYWCYRTYFLDALIRCYHNVGIFTITWPAVFPVNHTSWHLLHRDVLTTARLSLNFSMMIHVLLLPATHNSVSPPSSQQTICSIIRRSLCSRRERSKHCFRQTAM